MIKINGEDIIFSSGRVVCANKGIVGIASDSMNIYSGYDDNIHIHNINDTPNLKLNKTERK